MRDRVTVRRHRSARVLRGSVMGLLLASALAGCSREPETPGTPPRMSLVNSAQYLNSLSYIFGPSIDVSAQFPPMQRTDGLLANDAAIAGVTASQLGQFQRAAVAVATQVVDSQHRDFLIPCKPAAADAADKACATEFLSQTGRIVYRRALSDAEIATYVENAGNAAERLDDFYTGLAVALEGMLISPEALFVVERAEPDPENPGQLRLDAYSLASRLSFFLWNASPDDELLDAAESGELQTEDGLARAVDRMLTSSRLVDGVRAFFGDMLGFDDFETLSKDPTIYPAFTGVTAVAAREQTLRTIVDHLIVDKKDYRDLFTTHSTFISPALSMLYEIPAPTGWTPYTFPPDSARVGLLTQISFLALHAHPGRSSPTRRGVALRELLLCQEVPSPPPNVDFSIVNNPNSHYPTQRDRVAAHLQSPACAGCHKITDPIGLALENFNGAGRFRAKENGVPIDTSGNLDGVKFDTVAGLGKALHDNPALPQCFTRRLFSYAVGGSMATTKYRDFMTYLNESFTAEGYRLPDLLRTIALSDAFSRISESPDPAPAERPPESDEPQVTTTTAQNIG